MMPQEMRRGQDIQRGGLSFASSLHGNEVFHLDETQNLPGQFNVALLKEKTKVIVGFRKSFLCLVDGA